ncbi:MAG: aldehyde dehydrogenase family protein [Methanomassiliicoccaceae archaeon]|nr:aldehyde dehydrogenase family protein [Methanomassiliicoccaceae archaeon]
MKYDQTTKDAPKESDRDKKFDGALNSVLHTDKKDYPCYVGGLMVASGNEHTVSSPVDESIRFGRFQEPEDGLSDRAADVASDAFRIWSKIDKEKRSEIFVTALETIKRQKYKLAAAVTLSSGMTRDDSIYEVERLIEIIEEGSEKIKTAKGKPAGTWAVISEYNSPLAAPMGYAVSAMLAGSSVIVIPPKECPFPVYAVYEILAPLLPDGVLNIIFDRKGKAANALIENENIKGVVAVGRSDRFEDLMFAAINDQLLFIGEFKGMNPLVIYKPASMQAAANIAVTSAFRYGGQRIDSCSKVIVTVNEQKQFIEHLLAEANKMTVGDPAEKGTFVGPIISKENMENFLKIVKNSRDNLIFGGKRVTGEITDAGYYVLPAIFAGLPEDHEFNGIDHSLPVLSVQIVNDLSEAIEMAGDCEFGMSSGIVSKDEKVIEKFLGEVNSDVVYVNGPSETVGTAVRADVSEFLK